MVISKKNNIYNSVHIVNAYSYTFSKYIMYVVHTYMDQSRLLIDSFLIQNRSPQQRQWHRHCPKQYLSYPRHYHWYYLHHNFNYNDHPTFCHLYYHYHRHYLYRFCYRRTRRLRRRYYHSYHQHHYYYHSYHHHNNQNHSHQPWSMYRDSLEHSRVFATSATGWITACCPWVAWIGSICPSCRWRGCLHSNARYLIHLHLLHRHRHFHRARRRRCYLRWQAIKRLRWCCFDPSKTCKKNYTLVFRCFLYLYHTTTY